MTSAVKSQAYREKQNIYTLPVTSPANYYRQSIAYSHSVPNLNEFNFTPKKRYQERKLFCGCGAKAWAFAISGLQIFFAVSSVTLSLTLGSFKSESDSNSSSEFNEYKDAFSSCSKYAEIGFDLTFQLIQGTIFLLLGCILLAGVHYRKPVLLVFWLLVCGLGLLMVTVLLIILVMWLLFMGGGQVALFLIVVVLIPTLVQVFCFHVVYIHQRELSHLGNLKDSHCHDNLNGPNTPNHSLNRNFKMGGSKQNFFQM